MLRARFRCSYIREEGDERVVHLLGVGRTRGVVSLRVSRYGEGERFRAGEEYELAVVEGAPVSIRSSG